LQVIERTAPFFQEDDAEGVCAAMGRGERKFTDSG
jgi:hypothetical protein